MKELSAEEYGSILIDKISTQLKTGELHLLYLKESSEGKQIPEEYKSQVAQIKRFLERWTADEKFRIAVADNATAAAKSINLTIDPVALGLEALYNESVALSTREPSQAVLQYKSFIYEKLTHRNQIREKDETSQTAYNTWRAQQMKRCENQLPYFVSKSIVHAPFCIELSEGCSVGCWFCGISAPKLEDLYLYEDDNIILYRGVLNVMNEIFGSAAGKGFCYWATDPLDNPDYEKFLIDFEEITGVFPQTTTALPLKDIERTRGLLELSKKYAGNVDRFSLLSLKQMDKVFEHFTAEDLLYVELVTQNKENINVKSRSGRAIEREKRVGEIKGTGNQLSDGTIACVSGFLINMVQKSLKLITPCMATDKWPLGYIVVEEGSFDSVENFRELAWGMVNRNMKSMPESDKKLKLYEWLEVTETDTSIIISGREVKREIKKNRSIVSVMTHLQRGQYSISDMVTEPSFSHIPPPEIYMAVIQLMDLGLLNMEPKLESEMVYSIM